MENNEPKIDAKGFSGPMMNSAPKTQVGPIVGSIVIIIIIIACIFDITSPFYRFLVIGMITTDYNRMNSIWFNNTNTRRYRLLKI